MNEDSFFSNFRSSQTDALSAHFPQNPKARHTLFLPQEPPKAHPTFLKYEAVAGSHEYLKRLLSRAAKKKLRDGIKKVRKC